MDLNNFMKNISNLNYFVIFMLTHFEKLTITTLFSKNLYLSSEFRI